MGRIRTIKPAFFKHEELFEAEKASSLPLRVAFSGLWTVADRDGRFAWKPRALKTDVLPYDDVDFVFVLEALVKFGFVVKYTIGGREFGYIPSFGEHQVVNPRESKSVIPPHDAWRRVDANANPAHGEGKGKGREEEGKVDVSVAARVLSERIGNLDFRFQEQLARMLPTACKPDEDLEGCVDRMVGQWESYNAARNDLNYPVASSRKFFESGTWQDEKLWPWKDGKQPATKRRYVNE